MSPGRQAVRVWSGVAVAMVVTALVYSPGLAGPFVFDDLPSIINAPLLQMTSLDVDSIQDALYSAGASLPTRGLANLSFALNHYLSGGAFVATHMKGTNLAIHLATGLVLFALARRLARRAAPPDSRARDADVLALLVMAVWLLHPLELTSVLYVVQRMTSLSALCVLTGILGYVIGRQRLERGERGGVALILLGVFGATGIGMLVKENAALLPPLALLIEIVFFTRTDLPRSGRMFLSGLHGITVLLPGLALLALLVLRFDLIEGTYASRDFGPGERLLTQARVLFDYLQMFALPRLSAFGLFHDDFEISRDLLSPWTTLPAVVAWVVVAVVTAIGVLRRHGWAFGIAWFLIAHAVESTLIGLEMVHEHRNYLPLAGLVLGLAISARGVLARIGTRARLVSVTSVVMLAMLSFLTYVRADIWSTEAGLMNFTATVHPRSYRAASYQALTGVIAGQPLPQAYAGWTRAMKLTGSDHTALIEVIKLVSYVVTATPSDASPASCQPTASIPDELPEHPRCIEQLLVTLRAEMSERARSAPIPSTTVLALLHLGSCSLGGTRYCAVLRDDLTQWLVAALEGGRLRPRVRPMVTLLLARLKVASGDTEEGLRLAEKATQDSDHDPGYARELVLLHLALDLPERARATAARLLEPAYWRRGNEVVVRELSRSIDAHVGRAPAPG